MNRRTHWVIVCVLAAATSVLAEEPRFTAPVDQAGLSNRVAELRDRYEPFLRSLPPPLPSSGRTPLPKDWRFTYEAKESPKVEGIPEPPPWHAIGFDDSQWEKTTVPEWRYRTREGDDTARDPQTVDSWKNRETTADTICWYRTSFPAQKPTAGRRLWLCFDGVEWEAQVWLNGKFLGTHRVYYEPFRFDVTDVVEPVNTLAVRVIAGRSYGEPMTYWGMFPDIRAAQQRYTPDRATSIPGNLPIGYHSGCGFGIHRDVYLEQTGPARATAVFARNDLSDGKARVKVELDSVRAGAFELQVSLLPENFKGPPFEQTVRCELPAGASTRTVEIPMPGARLWSPDKPCLYRCRVVVRDSDARDVLFGCRSFSIVHHPEPARADAETKSLPDGMFLLNGRPVYLRGSNIQGLNAYAYWGQHDRLLHTILLLKAANFNVVRSCQHVQFPEVRELMDRMGMMSEQDQGGGYRGSIDMGIRREQHIHTGAVLARTCYNNPGVVLLCFGNEHEFPTEPIVRAALAEDPQRIFKPISGRFSHSKKPWDLPQDLRTNAIDDGHAYSGWYSKPAPQTWKFLETWSPRRMVTLGEFGAEALDAYETMRDSYPPQFRPPPPDADTLWAACQVQKQDVRQIAGLGRPPTNLAEYIEASQNYQESLLADKVIGMRLSPRAVSGYFHFHFIDVIPAFWPKSIVSHDHRPKKAYYQLAQLNQPVVALPRLSGAHPDGMQLWIANDLDEAFPQATLRWRVSHGGQTLLQGEQTLDVPALNVVSGREVDLLPVATKHTAFDIALEVHDKSGRLLSRYQRNVRVVPEELLKTAESSATADPFNKGK